MAVTGLEPLEDRRDTKILVKAAKFTRLPTHPMKERLGEPIKGRLKRESFVHQARTLERRDEDILEHEPREIPQCLLTQLRLGVGLPITIPWLNAVF